jgi:hypothetical protein
MRRAAGRRRTRVRGSLMAYPSLPRSLNMYENSSSGRSSLQSVNQGSP